MFRPLLLLDLIPHRRDEDNILVCILMQQLLERFRRLSVTKFPLAQLGEYREI